MILPEIGVIFNRGHYAAWGADTLTEAIPDVCPCCGAGKAKGRRKQGVVVKYKCGATYTEKPQHQTHTDVYWGICPALAEPYLCDKVGLSHNTPAGIVADMLEEMGFAEDATTVRRVMV